MAGPILRHFITVNGGGVGCGGQKRLSCEHGATEEERTGGSVLGARKRRPLFETAVGETAFRLEVDLRRQLDQPR